jgi:predicted ABC-type transport system involved in lysophospholipase L1 biosynthesis ATPase subunit
MELPPISQLPWAVGHDRFLAAAGAITGEGACCLFVIDEAIPASARSGYAALVIAYARSNEPVTILEGGAAALLIRDGGVASGEVAARRLLTQMSRLGLRETLRAGVAPLFGGVDDAIAQARALASGAPAGEVAVAA